MSRGDGDLAFLFRHPCGCASAVVVEDPGTLHYVDTLILWKRRKTGTIEHVTVDAAREALARTFKRHPAGQRRRKDWATPHQDGGDLRIGDEEATE